MSKGSTRHRRIPKIDCKNLKHWADGPRESILQPHIESYADACDRGWRAERDYFQAVCNEYHVRIDWRLQDHKEPPLPLPNYDHNAMPTIEKLTSEEVVAKSARLTQID